MLQTGEMLKMFDPVFKEVREIGEMLTMLQVLGKVGEPPPPKKLLTSLTFPVF